MCLAPKAHTQRDNERERTATAAALKTKSAGAPAPSKTLSRDPVIYLSRSVLECGGAPPLFGTRMRLDEVSTKHDVSATSCLTVLEIFVFFVIFCKNFSFMQRPVREADIRTRTAATTIEALARAQLGATMDLFENSTAQFSRALRAGV